MYSAWMQILLGGKPTQFRASAPLQIQLSKLLAYNQNFPNTNQTKPGNYKSNSAAFLKLQIMETKDEQKNVKDQTIV